MDIGVDTEQGKCYVRLAPKGHCTLFVRLSRDSINALHKMAVGL